MEKEIAIEKARPASTSSSDNNATMPQEPKDPKWEPGFVKRFPWIGFGALIMVLVCAVGSVIILVTSDHVSQTKWPEWYAPNILLNVMSQIENICFLVAMSNGVAIAWWRKTLKGSSIADLHRSWAFSTSIKEVVFSLKYFNIIALAAIMGKLVVIDSTLMQRATGTYLALDPARNISTVSGFVNQTFPVTGTVTGTNQQPGLMEHWMGDTLKMWSMQGGVYPNQWNGCEGSCFLDVPGIGFAFDCDDEVEESINFGHDLVAAFNSGQNATKSLFEIKFDTQYFNGSESAPVPGFWSNEISSYLQMNVSYTNAIDGSGNLSCPGSKSSYSCRLWPSIIKYPVLIQNSSSASTVSIGAQKQNLSDDTQDLGKFNQSGKQQNGFEFMRQIQILESHAALGDNINSSLSGIQLALDMYIRSYSMLSWDSSLDGSFVIDQMGHAANYMTDPPSKPRSCAFQYTNPLEPYSAPNGLFQLASIVGKINQIMFGLTTDVSLDDPNNDRTALTQFDAVEYAQTIHYQTNYPYMWGAIAATIICVLLVLPVFWGFWELGRKVTLNPFEIAYAFRSPVVGQASTAQSDELLQEVGGRQIRYGNIVSGEGRGRFGVDEPQNVAQPAGARSSWRVSRQSS